MSNLFSSITRGFGFAIGSSAAKSLLNRKSSKNLQPQSFSVKDKTCMSHWGYEENDVEISYDIRWNKEYVKWYSWPFFLLIPFFPFFYSLKRLFKVYFKNYKLHFYDLKWNTYTVSNAKYKNGIQEIKKLEPVFSKSENNPPYLRNKVEAWISLVLCLPINLLLFFTILTYEPKVESDSSKKTTDKIATINDNKSNGKKIKTLKFKKNKIEPELFHGPRGGTYYYSSTGKKVYVH